MATCDISGSMGYKWQQRSSFEGEGLVVAVSAVSKLAEFALLALLRAAQLAGDFDLLARLHPLLPELSLQLLALAVAALLQLLVEIVKFNHLVAALAVLCQ